MAKRKVTLLARLIDDADMLSNEELQTLSDTVWLKLQANKKMNKPESRPTERKPSQKRKAQTAIVPEVTTTIPDNAHCGKSDCYRPFDDNVHHKKLAEGYHEFVEPAGEASKGVGV